MRTIRMLTIAVSTVLAAGVVFTSPASAATSVTIDCAEQSSTNFTVSPGDTILFELHSSCVEALGTIDVNNQETFAAFVAGITQLTTGGTVVADWSTEPPSVTYTAGPNPGTDSLVMTFALRNRVQLRALPGTNAYYMTVPGGGAAPAPWLQAVGRVSGATCPAGWSPSWGQWMNDGQGGFTCVREQYYNTSTGMWGYRKQ